MNFKNLPSRGFVLSLLALAVVALVAATPASATPVYAWTVPSGDVTAMSPGYNVIGADIFQGQIQRTRHCAGYLRSRERLNCSGGCGYTGVETLALYNSSGVLPHIRERQRTSFHRRWWVLLGKPHSRIQCAYAPGGPKIQFGSHLELLLCGIWRRPECGCD